ncbi:MAG: hypothetical protein HY014_08210 [Acidobacteria bacterium]|nr:hypothetical protein [Acidobacteriota bacterium]MBI3488134.1 hypothetical protein [Acidobacteriota bacterium]
MLTPIESFLIAIDEQWPTGEEKITFRVLGSTALMLQTDYLRGTKDGDVLGVDPVSGDIAKALHGLAGQGSALSRQHGIFLDIVSRHTPFLAHPPNWIPVEALNQRLKSFEVFALDVQDVVVAKLKRFNENDMSDIRAMIERDLVDHAHLVRRFLSAADCFAVTRLAKEVPTYAMNLNFIEREYLGVPETEYELPDWADV